MLGKESWLCRLLPASLPSFHPQGWGGFVAELGGALCVCSGFWGWWGHRGVGAVEGVGRCPFPSATPHGCGDSSGSFPVPMGVRGSLRAPTTPVHVGEHRTAPWLSSFLLFPLSQPFSRHWFHWVELVLIKTS